MNKIVYIFFLTITTLVFASSELRKESKYSASLCKMFTEKALKYEKNMRKDEYAKVTLESYKNRAKIYCTK